MNYLKIAEILDYIFPSMEIRPDESLTVEGKIRFWYNWKGERLFKDF